MSWLFSRALVAASSAGTCSGGEPSAPSSTTPTPQAYLWHDKTTDAWRRFPSGMTCELFEANHGEELLTSFRAGFHARTFPQPDEERESTENEVDCGAKWPASLAKYDPSSRSWKTRQCLLLGDLAEYAETWPSWGMTRDGELFRRKTPYFLAALRASITYEKGSGSSLPTPRKQEPGRTTVGYGRGLAELIEGREQLPTVTARDWRSGKASEATMQRNSRPLSEKVGGLLNPPWVEWLMGWPIGWTELAASGTDRFQQWRQWHGDF